MSPRRSPSGTAIRAIAAEKLRLVEKVVQGRDFTVHPVEGVNALEAWLGAASPATPMPMCASPRSPPSISPTSSPCRRCGRGRSGTSISVLPPCSTARPKDRPRSAFRSHVGDVGHIASIVGPTGAGKSVLLALMALQFRRYEGATRVFAFDYRRQRSAPPRSRMGGDWQDLGGALHARRRAPVIGRATPAARAHRRGRPSAPGPPNGSLRSWLVGEGVDGRSGRPRSISGRRSASLATAPGSPSAR